MKRARTKRSLLRSEKGMATIEAIPLIIVFLMMFSYTLGAFGIVHTGILNSIAARTYAFETFRNRANVVYFRDMPNNFSPQHYRNVGARVHAVVSENTDTALRIYATERPIRVGLPGLETIGRDDPSLHMETIPQIADGKRTQVKASPVWIITQYGICINAACGD